MSAVLMWVPIIGDPVVEPATPLIADSEQLKVYLDDVALLLGEAWWKGFGGDSTGRMPDRREPADELQLLQPPWPVPMTPECRRLGSTSPFEPPGTVCCGLLGGELCPSIGHRRQRCEQRAFIRLARPSNLGRPRFFVLLHCYNPPQSPGL